MNTGINGTVTAISTADSRSANRMRTPADQRHGDRQHQRRQELADVRLELVDAGGDDRRLAAGEPTGRTIGVERRVVEHGDSDVAPQRPHRPGRGPLGDGRRQPPHDRDRRRVSSASVVRPSAISPSVTRSVSPSASASAWTTTAIAVTAATAATTTVGAQRRDQPDQSKVDRAAPVDVAHRWTIGRCWVPMRLRKTQYVQPWYSNTTGVMTSATIVITFKV